jgi:hypothetical protein
MSSTTDSTNTTSKKQSSQRRIEASRANGKKSRGPVTEEGKARSSQNARKHSVLATHICLNAVDEEIFDRILEQYVNRFQPRDQVEYDLVEKIVYCEFQIRHAWMERSAALAMQMTIDKDFVDGTWAAPSNTDRAVIALTASIKDGNTINLLDRYARTLSTQSERSMKQLIALQKLRIPPPPGAPELTAENGEPGALPNEPNPEIEHQSEESDMTADSQRPATVFAYSSPAYRVARVYFRPEQSQQAPRTVLLARAA